MIESLKRHITSRLKGDVPFIDMVLSHFKPKIIKRNEFLLKEGEVCRNVYFIVNGALQVFVYNNEINAITRDIVTENSWCTELNSFTRQKPAIENIKAIEDSELLVIDYLSFMKMMKDVPQFGMIYKQILEELNSGTINRLYTFSVISAQERLNWVATHKPAILTRFSGRIISSYLGISPETLSRLRKKL